MAALQPPARRRRRPRRGSLERPVNARLYRASFLVVLLPLVLLLATVTKPVALPGPTLPPAFDGDVAAGLARELATQYPDRSPGSSGALAAATWFRQKMAVFDLPTRTASWQEEIPGLGRRKLQNVMIVVQGSSPDVIAVLAHRDDTGTGPGANDNASGTAALLELARTYARPQSEAQTAVQPTHTLVFLSTDGGAYGGLGALRYARRAAEGGHVVAVLNLDALAGPGPPRLELAGDRPRSPAITLIQTASRRVIEQTGEHVEHPGVLAQLIDLGFPFTFYEQGPFVGRGIPAITLTSSGSRPVQSFGDSAGRLHVRKLTQLGRSAQETLGSLDNGLELTQGTTSYVWFGERIVRGWAIQLVLIALLVPFVVAAVDLFALCRRQRIALAAAGRSLRTRLLFWLFVGIVFTCFSALGAWPDGPPRPPNPESPAAADWRMLALLGMLAIVFGGWLVARRRLVPRREVTPQEQIAGHTVALLALGVVALLVVATNTFALLFLLPALHAWLWLPQVRTARLPLRLAIYAAGLAGIALLVLSFAWRFGLGLDTPWYVLTLVSTGYVKTTPVLVALAAVGCGAQLAAAAAGRYAPYPGPREERPAGPVQAVVRTGAHAVRERRRRREPARVTEPGS
jgi:hypothetical protein